MLIKLRNIFLALFIASVVSCEEKFQPELKPSAQNLIVVDGMISNLPGPYTVKLSLSSEVEDPHYIPLSGFYVLIEDNLGNHEQLQEISPGKYITSENGIQGIIGRKYKIEITATNGKQYTSDFEELLNPVGIDSIYTKVEYREEQNLPYDDAGYQFYVDTKMAENDSTFFLWDITATYKYKSDFIIRWIYDGELRPYTNSDTLRTCWLTKNIPGIYIYSTSHLAQPKLSGVPLHYVSTAVRDLSIRYSLLTSQFTISKHAYDFWGAIKEIHTETDGLYTRQPYQIRGNIFNPQNKDEPVLGYFLVAGEVQNRIFVNKPEAPVIMRYPVCVLTEADFMNFGDLFRTSPAEWPLYATYNAAGANAYPNQDCLDCRLRGGTIEKPDFWIDY